MNTAFETANDLALRILTAYSIETCPRFLHVSEHGNSISLSDTDHFYHPFHPKKEYGCNTHLIYVGLNIGLPTLNKLGCQVGEMEWSLSPDAISESFNHYPRKRLDRHSHAVTLTWSSGANHNHQSGQLIQVQLRTWDFPREDEKAKGGTILYEMDESGSLIKTKSTLREERDAKFNPNFWDWYHSYYGSHDGQVYFPELIDYESKARQILCLSQLEYFAYALESALGQ